MLALTSVALADQVVNLIDTTNDRSETVTIQAGLSATVDFYILATNDLTGVPDVNRCNVSTSTPASLTVTPPAGVAASPGTVTFTNCGTGAKQSIAFSSSTPGDYAIMNFSVSGGVFGSLWVYDRAHFTLIVSAPPDSSPPIITPDVSGARRQRLVRQRRYGVLRVFDPESPVTWTNGCCPTLINYDTAVRSDVYCYQRRRAKRGLVGH
jgi:hypothetical protein